MFNNQWAQLALGGAVAFLGCTLIGYLKGAENLKKKKPAGGHMQFGGAQSAPEDDKLDMVFRKAEAMMRQEKYEEAESLYQESLELISELPPGPQIFYIQYMILQKLLEAALRLNKDTAIERYLNRTIDLWQGRDLTPQDQREYMELLERATDFYFGKLKDYDKALGPLTLWRDLAEVMRQETHICITNNLIGKIKKDQMKFTEAEECFRRSLTCPIHKAPDVHISSKLFLGQVLKELGRTDEAREIYTELAASIEKGRDPPHKIAEMLVSLGDMCIESGFYPEAEAMLQRALNIFGMLQLTPKILETQCSFAQLYTEMGRLDEVRVTIKKIKSSYDGLTMVPLCFSKYMRTVDVEVIPTTSVVRILLAMREPKLPAGSCVVARIENPSREEDRPTLEAEHIIVEGEEDIKFEVPFVSANKGIYTAEIEIFKDATRAEKKGTHFQVYNCPADVAARIPVEAANGTH
jgi:tetratricopeptide (TPR) repeat protein